MKTKIVIICAIVLLVLTSVLFFKAHGTGKKYLTPGKSLILKDLTITEKLVTLDQTGNTPVAELLFSGSEQKTVWVKAGETVTILNHAIHIVSIDLAEDNIELEIK